MGPRLYHKKSKTGCLRCRGRHVKCDEARPDCGDCCRHGVQCVYENQSRRHQADWSSPENISQSEATSSRVASPPFNRELDLPESRARRLRELRLLCQYANSTCMTLDESAGDSPSPSLPVWKDAVLRFALVSDAMLYSVLALAAQHLASINPLDSDAIAASPTYLSLCLPLHRLDVAELNRANADLVCLTGSVLRATAFVALQARSIQPYTPPTQFLLLALGSLKVFREVQKLVTNDPESIVWGMILREPYLNDTRERFDLFSEESRQSLLHLLHRSPEHFATEPWCGEIQAAYEDTISYIGRAQMIAVHQSLLNPTSFESRDPQYHTHARTSTADTVEPLDSLLRRLVVFPSVVPQAFIQLVLEAKPRALVVLAHYFALLARFGHVWWAARTGMREIQGILTKLEGLAWESSIVSKLLQKLQTTAPNVS